MRGLGVSLMLCSTVRIIRDGERETPNGGLTLVRIRHFVAQLFLCLGKVVIRRTYELITSLWELGRKCVDIAGKHSYAYLKSFALGFAKAEMQGYVRCSSPTQTWNPETETYLDYHMVWNVT